MAVAAQDLVGAAMGAPPASPGFSWHDEPAVGELFSRHRMTAVAAGGHEPVFEAASPEAYLDAERELHPLAVTGFQLLQQKGQTEQAHERLLQVLNEHNEDSHAFRSTSRTWCSSHDETDTQSQP